MTDLTVPQTRVVKAIREATAMGAPHASARPGAPVVRVARVLGVMPDDLRPQLQRLDERGVVRMIPAAYEPGQQRERPVWSERVELRGGAS